MPYARRPMNQERRAVRLAEREINKVDRDNRLVAAELERQWEVALSEFLAAEVPPLSPT